MRICGPEKPFRPAGPPWGAVVPHRRARAKGKILGRPKFSDGDELVLALETGDSWHRVSKVTKIPYSTVKKHARVLGYEPKRREPRRNKNNRHG